MSLKQAKKKDPWKAALPALGFIVLLICGAIGWFTSPFLATIVAENFPDIPDTEETRYLSAFIITLSLVMIISFVYAIFAPKPPKVVSEKVLMKEKRERQTEEKERRINQRRVELERRKQLRKQQNKK